MTDLWDREYESSRDRDPALEREEEHRDAVEFARIERLYDVGGFPVFKCNPELAYDLLDPKHERHHEVLADLWDNRPGK